MTGGHRAATDRHPPTAFAARRGLDRSRLLPRFGALRLPEVTPDRVLQMKHDLAATPVAANRALQQLSAAFAFAMRMEWVARNPADERKIDRYTESPDAQAGAAAEIGRYLGGLLEGVPEANAPPPEEPAPAAPGT